MDTQTADYRPCYIIDFALPDGREYASVRWDFDAARDHLRVMVADGAESGTVRCARTRRELFVVRSDGTELDADALDAEAETYAASAERELDALCDAQYEPSEAEIDAHIAAAAVHPLYDVECGHCRATFRTFEACQAHLCPDTKARDEQVAGQVAALRLRNEELKKRVAELEALVTKREATVRAVMFRNELLSEELAKREADLVRVEGWLDCANERIASLEEQL